VTRPGKLMIAIVAALLPLPGAGEPVVELTGREIIDQVQERHRQYPYVYEEQSIVLTDRNGKRDSRKAFQYSRTYDDGAMDFLLVFDFPDEVRGVAVLARRDAAGVVRKQVYLPALGERLVESGSAGDQGNFLGTDFSVENIAGETAGQHSYLRRGDTELDSARYFVIDVFGAGKDNGAEQPLRRHFVRQDNFFITRTDHYDVQGRLHKRQTWHDLARVDGDMWRSNMILMVDVKEEHETLVKTERRILSRDYVPERVFTADWLFEQYPVIRDPVPAAPAEAEGDAVADSHGGGAATP